MQNLTALENVELAMQICKYPLDAKKVLEEVGLKERMNNFPSTAFRRRATKGGDCTCTCEKSKITAV